MERYFVKCFVNDKNKNCIATHTFYSKDPDLVYAISTGFNQAMKEYCKDYTVNTTPIGIDVDGREYKIYNKEV